MSLPYKNHIIDWFPQGTNIGHLWLDKWTSKEKSK